MSIGSKELFFSQSNSNGTIFLDFFDYANVLFNNGKEDIYLNPETFISVYSQAERLLSPDILDIYASPFYRSFLDQESEMIESWKGRRTSLALKKTFGLDKPKTVLSEIINAMKSLYPNHPLVLTIDSPQKWLQQTHKLVNPEQEENLSLDELERGAMYIAEFLRSFSTLGVNGVVLREFDESTLAHEEVLSSYQPIINVINHYKWPLGILFEKGIIQSSDISNKVDFYLFQSTDFSEVSTFWEENLLVGGGLNTDFWMGNQKVDRNLRKGLYFGKIPPKAEPETVLTQLKALRS